MLNARLDLQRKIDEDGKFGNQTDTRCAISSGATRSWLTARSPADMGRAGIVNLAARGMLVVSVARRLGSEGPLLAYYAAPL
jgi:hypothetical protein